MKKSINSILIAGVCVLLISVLLLYSVIYFYPSMMEEYYDQVFRSSSFETDWLFYIHPFVLSAALYWFWKSVANSFEGSVFIRSAKAAFAYALVALVPVLWLTFSAIEISYGMVGTWMGYGITQAFVAFAVFAYKES